MQSASRLRLLLWQHWQCARSCENVFFRPIPSPQSHTHTNTTTISRTISTQQTTKCVDVCFARASWPLAVFDRIYKITEDCDANYPQFSQTSKNPPARATSTTNYNPCIHCVRLRMAIYKRQNYTTLYTCRCVWIVKCKLIVSIVRGLMLGIRFCCKQTENTHNHTFSDRECACT